MFVSFFSCKINFLVLVFVGVMIYLLFILNLFFCFISNDNSLIDLNVMFLNIIFELFVR